MNNVGKFMVVDEESWLVVNEVADGQNPRDGRRCGSFGTFAPLGGGADKRAASFADHLRREHANGRVPQSFCGTTKEGRTPCDFDRVNATEMMTQAQRDALVLCDRHKGSFR